MIDELNLRPLQVSDAPEIATAFTAQGWQKPVEQYLAYCREQEAGAILVTTARLDDDFAGYLVLRWQSGYPPFAASGIPEICDLNVLKIFQKRGLASLLMDWAEHRVKESGGTEVGLRVGLYEGYGVAHRMYVKRGYLPDGRPVSYRGVPLNYGDQATVDDELNLAFCKKL